MQYNFQVTENKNGFINGQELNTQANSLRGQIISRAFEEQNVFVPVKTANSTQIVTNMYAVQEACKQGKQKEIETAFDKTLSKIHDQNKIYNSTGNDFNSPVGPYEQFMSFVIKPLQVNIGEKATWDQASQMTVTTSATLDDLIKPMVGASIKPYSEKLVGSLMNYKNHNLPIQSPLRPNPYDTRNQSVSIGDFQRLDAPQASYARTISYDVNQREQLKANAYYGNSVSIEEVTAKTLEIDEMIHVYNILSADEAPIKGATIVEQTGDVPNSTDLFAGLVYKYAFLESTPAEFIALVERIKALVNQKSYQISTSFNRINRLVIPQKEMNLLKTAFYIDPLAPISNVKQAYNYRLDYLVDKMRALGITVIGLNQCDPNDEDLGTPGVAGLPIIPRRNPLPNGKSLYMLLSDNSGINQDIIYAPKVQFMVTDFVSVDNLGWNMSMLKVDFFGGVRYMRPELNRFIATTPNAQ